MKEQSMVIKKQDVLIEQMQMYIEKDVLNDG